MMRLIPLRFDDYCRACGQRIPAGSPAAWFGKKDGVKHISCHLSNKKVLETSLEW